MTTIVDPVIGDWYKDVENDLMFKVVAIEESDDTIEVQYFNGDIGEYDKDSWYNSTFDYVEAPEDWSAPFDEIEAEDLGYSDPDTHEVNKNDLDVDEWLDR